MKLRKLVFGLLVAIVSQISFAQHDHYVGNVTPRAIYGSNSIVFGTTEQPAGTCSYYFRYFRFDATTQAGKNMLQMLLVATAAGRGLDVWYIGSTAAGQNETNGCTEANLAEVTAIGIR